MRYRRFGRTGWQVSEIGYGMWGMGGWTGSDDGESLASLRHAVELGCNFFDTALVYGKGHSERLLGQLLRGAAGHRIFSATKLPPLDGRWPPVPGTPVAETFPAAHILACVEESLRNLGVERLDLVQFHVWDDRWTASDGWREALLELKAAGKIEAAGISINRWQPENCLLALATGDIDAVQVVYNIFDQSPEDRLFPACRAQDIAVIARVPFDEGTLTGTLTRQSTWPEGDWRNTYFGAGNLAASVERAEALGPLVPRGMTLPELALRFILTAPEVCTTIPGMRRRAHVDTNLAVADGTRLAPELVAKLRPHRWDRSTAAR